MTQQTNQREIRFRAWETFPGYSEPSVMHSWEELNKLDTEGLLHLCDILEGKEKHVSSMQFTGIQDIHKKDVYEGDKTHDGVIEFNTETCCYIIRRANGTFIRLEVRKKDLEIIGNIYENPELLNQ